MTGELGQWQPAIDRATELPNVVSPMLRLRDAEGRELQQESLQTPLSMLEAVEVPGEQPLLLLSQYDGAGFGSWSGWLTSVLEVRNRQIQRPEASEAGNGTTGPVRWRRGLKADWRLRAGPGSLEVFSLRCQPTSTGEEFELVKHRDVRRGERWIRVTGLEPGFWEMDQPFPPLESWP